MLTIAEELLLLCLNERTCETRSVCERPLPYGLSGALLLELVVQKRIELRGKKVVVIDEKPTGDKVLDEVLKSTIPDSGNLEASHWIRKLGDSDIYSRLKERLVHRGILQKEKQRKWGMFSSTSWSIKDRERVESLQEKIRSLPKDTRVPDERTLVLASVALKCNLVRVLFPEEEQSRARRRLRELSRGEIYKEAVSDTIVGMQAAATVAAVATVTDM
ncbi:Golgi phosphoprotein 3 (GPP34) [Marininema mesophilum]|uniref:Golgi phosphoprotein 3 (GPP34) n=1 Tax=Marininema mesophilum TaxID=1048340 RepID=A0A1H3BE26_9BACL|nr:GPP34 family phosphoprotein [Marininema mesophilum]SDX39289.1 Golgi phosphoprotein 3 (GPP34) [Marininema mesophilum]